MGATLECRISGVIDRDSVRTSDRSFERGVVREGVLADRIMSLAGESEISGRACVETRFESARDLYAELGKKLGPVDSSASCSAFCSSSSSDEKARFNAGAMKRLRDSL
jgi:hypothetical protein